MGLESMLGQSGLYALCEQQYCMYSIPGNGSGINAGPVRLYALCEQQYCMYSIPGNGSGINAGPVRAIALKTGIHF
jgi:hypothetical protein